MIIRFDTGRDVIPIISIAKYRNDADLLKQVSMNFSSLPLSIQSINDCLNSVIVNSYVEILVWLFSEIQKQSSLICYQPQIRDGTETQQCE